jgi:glycosyltransferase involved in cell wall biosynthesis
MKIAFISTMGGFAWGGSEELWASAAKLAMQDNHQVIISVYGWEQVPKKIRELQSKGAEVRFRERDIYDFTSKLKRVFKNKILMSNPYAEVFSAKPDVICISMGTTPEILPDHHLFDLLDKTIIPFYLISQFNFESGIVDYELTKSKKHIYAKAKKFFFVSERNRETAEAQLLLKLNNSLVISNPVNIESKQIIKLPVNEEIQFASIARLDCKIKGQDILFKILSGKIWKDRNWKLNLYGEGIDEKYLKELVSYYELNNRVVFHGNVDDIVNVWSESHLLLLPSIAEGTPLALIEAMLCGRTAVVTDVGGNADYIQEGITGFLAEASTAKSFGSAMERAWTVKDNWGRMGEKAYDFASNKIDHTPGRTLLDYLVTN